MSEKQGFPLSTSACWVRATDGCIRLLPILDYVACFLPLALLIGDQLLLKTYGVAVLPYAHLDKGYFFVGMFLVIVFCVSITIELRSSALENDAFTPVEMLSGQVNFPVFNTTTKLMDSYFSKKANNKKIAPVVAYAVLLLTAEIAFGCMLAATIFISYFRM